MCTPALSTFFIEEITPFHHHRYDPVMSTKAFRIALLDFQNNETAAKLLYQMKKQPSRWAKFTLMPTMKEPFYNKTKWGIQQLSQNDNTIQVDLASEAKTFTRTP